MPALEQDQRTPHYDKVRNIKWLVDDLRNGFRESFNLGPMIIIDKMMSRYTDKYCLNRQYIPKKPIKGGGANLVLE